MLRIWPAPVRLTSDTPLWVARYERMHGRRLLRLLTLWQPEPHTHALPDDLRLLAGTSAEHDAVLQIRIDTPRTHAP